nr:MAG TPA: hypothetical protein [Ackermannviridae sp.]
MSFTDVIVFYYSFGHKLNPHSTILLISNYY